MMVDDTVFHIYEFHSQKTYYDIWSANCKKEKKNKRVPLTGFIAAETTYPRRLALNKTLFFLPFCTPYLLLFFSTPATSLVFYLAFITFSTVTHPLAGMFLTVKCSFTNIATRKITFCIGVNSTAESQYLLQGAVTFRMCCDLTWRTGPRMTLERTWVTTSALTGTST